MGMRFNPAPGWPPLPEGFTPQPGWQPDPSWPAAPPGWQLWVDDGQPSAPGPAPAANQVPGAFQPPGPQSAATPPPNPYQAPGAQAPGTPAPDGPNPYQAPGAVPPYYAPGGAGGRGPRRFNRLTIRLISLGVVAVIAIIIAVVTHLNSAGRSDANGQITKKGSLSIEDLQVGDCFNQPATGEVANVTAIPCTQPHDSQIYAKFDLTGSSYPGDDSVNSQADKGCESRQDALNQNDLTDDMSMGEVVPTSDSWSTGDRTVACGVSASSKTLTKSLLNS